MQQNKTCTREASISPRITRGPNDLDYSLASLSRSPRGSKPTGAASLKPEANQRIQRTPRSSSFIELIDLQVGFRYLSLRLLALAFPAL